MARKALIVIGALAVAVLAIAGVAKADNDHGVHHVDKEPLVWKASGEEVAQSGRVKLTRRHDRVRVQTHGRDLTPGHAYTGWFNVYNHPEHCATSPCTKADRANPEVQFSSIWSGYGGVANPSGKLTQHVTVLTGAENAPGYINTGPGLLNPTTSQIDIVIRTHGQASDDPDTLIAQTTTLNGGCNPDCVSVQQATFLPPGW